MMRNMPRLSQEHLVAIMVDFYNFFVRFYIPCSSLKHPPLEGWPNITTETTKNLGKNEFRHSLLKIRLVLEKNEGNVVASLKGDVKSILLLNF
jgi:hypothetical protein